MERVEFIKKFAVGGSILLTAPVLFNSCSDDSSEDDGGGNGNGNSAGNTVDLTSSEYSSLGTVGGFAHKGSIIIIRTGDSSYVALSNICTHQSCKVGYEHSSTTVVCPCHGSKFSTSGDVVSGPAPTNLKSYNVKKEGDKLIIS